MRGLISPAPEKTAEMGNRPALFGLYRCARCVPTVLRDRYRALGTGDTIEGDRPGATAQPSVPPAIDHPSPRSLDSFVGLHLPAGRSLDDLAKAAIGQVLNGGDGRFQADHVVRVWCPTAGHQSPLTSAAFISFAMSKLGWTGGMAETLAASPDDV